MWLLVIQRNLTWNLSFIWFMRGRIWSVTILQWNLQKHYKLYHCFICNALLLVIQWNVTWNLLFIWFIRGRIWSVTILQWNLQNHYELNHCFICNISNITSDSMKCNLGSLLSIWFTRSAIFIQKKQWRKRIKQEEISRENAYARK